MQRHQADCTRRLHPPSRCTSPRPPQPNWQFQFAACLQHLGPDPGPDASDAATCNRLAAVQSCECEINGYRTALDGCSSAGRQCVVEASTLGLCNFTSTSCDGGGGSGNGSGHADEDKDEGEDDDDDEEE